MEVIGTALGIFVLRVIGNLLTTLRLIMNTRGQLRPAFIIAILESSIFALALGVVVTNINSIPNLVAYSVGFAVGGYIAMRIEGHVTTSFVQVTAISVSQGHDIAEAIRGAGMGATETEGHGARGNVSMVQSIIERRQLKQCLALIAEIDPSAFVTTTILQGTQHGFINIQPGLSRIFTANK